MRQAEYSKNRNCPSCVDRRRSYENIRSVVGSQRRLNSASGRNRQAATSSPEFRQHILTAFATPTRTARRDLRTFRVRYTNWEKSRGLRNFLIRGSLAQLGFPDKQRASRNQNNAPHNAQQASVDWRKHPITNVQHCAEWKKMSC